MRGKKQIAAAVAFTGVTRLVEALPAPPSLLVLNYHRIGDADKTPYDSGVFSCSTADFDWQIDYLKQRYEIVDLTQALELVHGRAGSRHASVLLTFDDGYRDNFDEAFHVLKRQGVSGTFFLPTGFIGTTRLPWWDVIAYVVKHAQADRITLTYPEVAMFDLAHAKRRRAVEQIIELFKLTTVTDTERFLAELEVACKCSRPAASDERCFLDWNEARQMQAAGMCFGSHTHSHEILAKLSYARQLDELQTSREIMEAELGAPIDILAYPVGQLDTFSAETFKALREARYSTAFSLHSGVNIPGQIEPFDVLRGAADGESRAVFRLRVTLRAATRSRLI